MTHHSFYRDLLIILLTVGIVMTLSGILLFLVGVEAFIREILGKAYSYIIFGAVATMVAYFLVRKRGQKPSHPPPRSRLTLKLQEREIFFEENSEKKVGGQIIKVGHGNIAGFFLGFKPKLDIPLRIKIEWNGDEDQIDNARPLCWRNVDFTPSEERPISFTIYNPNRPGATFNIIFEVTTKDPFITYTLEEYIHVVCSRRQ